jgi:hypothetical protein
MESERRKHERATKVATVSLCYDGTKKIDGAVINISKKGLCFYADKVLEPGLTMRVDGTFRLKYFSKDCTIIWCKKVAIDLYKIGISYDEDS